MSYEPTNWQTGDVVTSQKLNKLEQGVADAGGGGGNLVVTITKTEEGDIATYTTDKTAGEIKAALESGRGVVIPYTVVDEEGTYYFNSIVGGSDTSTIFGESTGTYGLMVPSIIVGTMNTLQMLAQTLDDYLYAEFGK